jgi:hypothetical protein
MKHLNMTLLATLLNQIGLWANDCGYEVRVKAFE